MFWFFMPVLAGLGLLQELDLPFGTTLPAKADVQVDFEFDDYQEESDSSVPVKVSKNYKGRFILHCLRCGSAKQRPATTKLRLRKYAKPFSQKL